ncbi:BatA domain-containing protein [candidate division KSB1 bacterium]|nr:BatA domain-containing protein [candidate division KSB1 bacterium]
MNFLNTAILLGLIAATFPLLIHLFNRTRSKSIPFSSLRFLRRLQQTSVRRFRLLQILLLILRTGIIVFLVLAFARPTLRGHLSFWGAANARTSAVVILDDSASMNRIDENGVVMDQARKVARVIPEVMRGGDALHLVLASDTTATFSSRAFQNFEDYVQRIDATEAVNRRADLNAALRCAQGILQKAGDLNREIYVLSDFQSSAFAFSDSAVWNEVETPLIGVRLGRTPAVNLSVQAVRPASALIQPGSMVEFVAQVKNTGREPLESQLLQLYIGDERVAQATTSLQPAVSDKVSLRAVVSGTGNFIGRIVAEDDPYLADNTRFFTFFVPEAITVACVASDPQESRYLMMALKTASGEHQAIQIETMTPEELAVRASSHLDVLILCNVQRLSLQAIERLQRMQGEGTGLFFILGDRVDLRFYNQEIIDHFSLPLLVKPIELDPLGKGWLTIAQTDLLHPIFHGVFNPAGGEIQTPRFFFAIQSQQTEQSDPILSFTGGDPLLYEIKSDRAPILVLTTGLRPDLGDFYRKPLFAPLMVRAVRYLGLSDNSLPAHYWVGDLLPHRLSGARLAQKLVVSRPDGRLDSVRPSIRGDGAWIHYQDTDSPGIYTLFSDDRPNVHWAVNLDVDESEFEAISPKKLGRVTWITDVDELPMQVKNLRYGRELWQIFVAVALLLLLVEMMIWRVSAPAGERQ